MEESYLQHENKVLKDELLELHRKLEEVKLANNLLYGTLMKYLEDSSELRDPANYCFNHLILN